MLSLYTLKFPHIILAIIAVGFSTTYGLLIGRARRRGTDGREMKLRATHHQFMDDYIANPSYILLRMTGVGMVQDAGYPFSLKWIHGSMALLLRDRRDRIRASTPHPAPTARSARDPRAEQTPSSSGCRSAAACSAACSASSLAILSLMVFKPA